MNFPINLRRRYQNAIRQLKTTNSSRACPTSAPPPSSPFCLRIVFVLRGINLFRRKEFTDRRTYIQPLRFLLPASPESALSPLVVTDILLHSIRNLSHTLPHRHLSSSFLFFVLYILWPLVDSSVSLCILSLQFTYQEFPFSSRLNNIVGLFAYIVNFLQARTSVCLSKIPPIFDRVMLLRNLLIRGRYLGFFINASVNVCISSRPNSPIVLFGGTYK